MRTAPTEQLVSRAEALYRRLLFIYPPAFRRSYGQQMAQTFRDCWREALKQEKGLSQVRFWCSIVYDLTTTASSEHVKAGFRLFKRLTGLEKEFSMARLLSLDVASRTDIGRTRTLNEDNVLAAVPEDAQVMENKGALFIVADGLGGHTKGDVASELAVTVIREAYYQDQSDDLLASLRRAVERANAEIFARNEVQFKGADERKQHGMGTTCVAAVLKDSTVYVANAGDSLAYIARGDQMQQIAENHSWVSEQVRTGAMTRDEAEAQGKGNLITRCLGPSLDVEVYAASQQVEDGDVLVLCTDGLHNQVSEDEIRTIVEQYGSEESTTRLIARANETGGPDNITALVARVALAGK